MLILWCRTAICSCKFSSKVSLMLDNPFLVPSLCKLNHISFYFIHISTKSPGKLLIPSGKAMLFFWSHPRYLGAPGKFQHNMKISIKMTHVSRLSVSCQSHHERNFKKIALAPHDYAESFNFIWFVNCKTIKIKLKWMFHNGWFER